MRENLSQVNMYLFGTYHVFALGAETKDHQSLGAPTVDLWQRFSMSDSAELHGDLGPPKRLG